METSSPRLSLAAGDEANVLGTYDSPLHWRHAETLFTALDRLMRRLRWKPAMLSGVAVSVGPGSFTGIRIGLAAARSMGQALHIPVVGVSSLETLAWPLLKDGRWVSPVLDALRGDVFTGIFQRGRGGRTSRWLPESRLSAQHWLKAVRMLPRPEPVWVAGEPAVLGGIEKTVRRIHDAGSSHLYPKASALLELARPRLSKAGSRSYGHARPLYLRDAAAQERRHASTGPAKRRLAR